MAADWRQERVSVGGVTVQLREKGEGPPLVVLHGEEVGCQVLPFHHSLAEQFRVLVPSLPGVGGSELPEWVDSVDDLTFWSQSGAGSLGGLCCGAAGPKRGGPRLSSLSATRLRQNSQPGVHHGWSGRSFAFSKLCRRIAEGDPGIAKQGI